MISQEKWPCKVKIYFPNDAHLFTSGPLSETLPMIKTLLIDLDGTLLGTHTVRLNLAFTYHFIQSLRAHQIPAIKAAKILHQLKLSMREIGHQNNGVVNWVKAVNFFSQLSGKSLKDSEHILTSTALMCFQKSKSTLFAKPDALEFIAWAKNHYQLILATNPLWPLEVVLYRLGIAEISPDHFSFITHAENMSASKPHVEYYRELQAMRELEASTCLMIGNDHKKDGPASELGIEVWIIDNQTTFSDLKKRLQKDLL